MLTAPDVPGLAALLAPLSPARFFAEHWPARHAVVHGPLGRLTWLARVPELSDLAALLEARRAGPPVQVILPDHRDQSSSIFIDAAEAHRLYQNGLSLLVGSAEVTAPGLHPWLCGIAADLGLPRTANPRCLVYASRRGGGANPHFDANANFSLQLRGRKRWRIAANEQVMHPVHRFVMGSRSLHAELQPYTRLAELPRALPSDAVEIELQPGSLLFVPRGAWHATDAIDDESLSLNFTFSQPSWAELVLEALRALLLAHEDWRALADGVNAREPERTARAQARLATLLEELPGQIDGLAAAAVLAETQRPHRLRTSRSVSAVQAGAAIVVTASDGARRELLLDPRLGTAAAWLLAQTAPFTVDDVLARAADAPPAAARALVDGLLDAGVLERP